MSEQAGVPERLLTPEQVAERLSLSVLTVRAWLRSGRLPGVKPGGKVWRVREADLDEYIRGLSQGNGSRGDGHGRRERVAAAKADAAKPRTPR
jgi:excisionase family DNA binding protein